MKSMAVRLVTLLTILVLSFTMLTPSLAETDEITVVFGNASFSSLDPQTHAGTILGGVLGNLYETLVVRSADGSYSPVLATEWTKIDEVTTEFQIRKDVFFHDGTPLTAKDVKFSIERAMDPVINAKNGHNFSSIKEVQIVDDYTVRVITNTEDPLLVSRMAAWPMSIVCADYVQKIGDEQFALAPNGTGPYVFESYQADADLVFKANEKYWGGVPAIKGVRWRVVAEPGARMAELQAGTAHIVDGVPFDQITALDAQDGISIDSSMGIRTVYLQLDCAVEPTNNVAVRQAIAYSIDLDSIINDLLMGYANRIATFAVPEVSYFDPSIEPCPYDVDKARDLLVGAGYGDQLPLKLTFDLSPGRVSMDREVAEVITAMLNETGLFDVTLVVNESGVYSEKYSKKELPHTIGQIVMATHGNYTYDPDFTLTRSFLSIEEPRAIIDSHRYHKDWDELILKASTSTDSNERAEIYSTMQKLIYEDMPRVYLYQQVVTWGISDLIDWTPDGEMVSVFNIKPAD